MSPPASAGRPSVTPSDGWSPQQWRIGLAFLAAAAFALRVPALGYPLIDVDEEFYLLVGDRMLHGAIPYVDIWDRKPPGLFLLYAAIRLLGGDGILQYQIVAALFATATAVAIALIARRIAHPLAALTAGLVYVAAAALLGGRGGQTPIFYNLPVALSALILLGLASPAGGQGVSSSAIRWRGMIAMLLMGLAIQLKPTAVFEGIYFGLILLWLSRRAGTRPAALAGDAAIWIGTALAPSLIAWLTYAGIGQGQAFFYANVGSIFARSDADTVKPLKNLGKIAVRIAPLLLTIIIGEWLLRKDAPWRRSAADKAAYLFLAGWCVAAVGGFAAFGTYFEHYALPLLPPLAVIAAATFSIRTRLAGPVLAALTLAFLLIFGRIDYRKYLDKRGDTAFAARMEQAIASHLDGGCLYIFYGEPIYYHLSNACMPTRWPFPFHLSLAREAGAIGVDPEAEIRRILASRPTVIVDRLNSDSEINVHVQTILRDALARDYRLVFTGAHKGKHNDVDQVWARRTPDR